MIYRLPAVEDAIDQGDVLEGCPVQSLLHFDLDNLATSEVKHTLQRVLVLTQTCDLANKSPAKVVAATVYDAQFLVARQVLKPADVKGSIRAGRVFGWYFLPKSAEFGLPEMIVDFRQVHTVRLDLLTALCQRGRRKARVQPLYREHLAKHF